MDLDSLLNDGDVTMESIEGIKDSIDDLVKSYEDRISELESDNDEQYDDNIRLKEELNTYTCGSLETFATSVLKTFTGDEPNLGTVLSFKEDLQNLLTTKYHVSIGNL